MRLRVKGRTISARGPVLGPDPVHKLLLQSIFLLLFFRKAALTGLPIEVIRGSETPVVRVITISEISQ